MEDCDVIILDEPTRGIDVGAKSEIYGLMTELVKKGKGVIMISSEMPEIIGMCDNVIIMHERRMAGMLKEKNCHSRKLCHTVHDFMIIKTRKQRKRKRRTLK